MQVVFRFETRELKRIPERTVYNSICHELTVPYFGITHLYEIYDDVGFEPMYKLGKFVPNKDLQLQFFTLLTGLGEAVPEGYENCGGVYVDIEISGSKYLDIIY